MKVAFFQSFLNERGTSNTMFDYAFYNEKILGNESVILYCPDDNRNEQTAIKKFTENFRTYRLEGINDKTCYDPSKIVPAIDRVLEREKCHVLYQQKYGINDGVLSSVCKNVILVAANVNDVHGDRYVYVSKWLSDVCSDGKIPWIPIIIDLPSTTDDMRKELGIPNDAVVFGRNGGMDTWNIPWADYVINEVLKQRTDVFFVFQNTPIRFNHPNVKYVQTTVDTSFKSRFINTCDAMIHARLDGESFGMSVAEFSTKNKPVLTFGSPTVAENHIRMLKDKGIYYNNPNELFNALITFKKQSTEIDCNCYKEHTPMKGIMRFKELLLDGLFE